MDTAKSWQQTLTEHLIEIGFKRGRGHIRVFHHPERNIRTLVHGDDYCSAGARGDFDWLQAKLEKAYELKTQRISNRKDCTTEGKVLNRIVRWIKEGYELEGDPRHAELVVEQLELGNVAPLSSPGVDCVETDKDDPGDIELDPATASTYRSIVARCITWLPIAPSCSLQSVKRAAR